MAAIQAVPREWKSGEVSLVADVAERTWAAVERARAEAALRESEERYRMLFEAIDEGVVLGELIRDEQGEAVDFRYLELNPALERHAGWKVAEPLGRRLTELVPASEAKYWIDSFSDVIASGTAKRFEHFIEAAHGWFSVNVTPYGADRIATVYENITERKRAEQTLRESEERQAFLLKLSDALRPIEEPFAIQSEASRILREQLGADRVAYAELNPDEDTARLLTDNRDESVPPLTRDTYRWSDFDPFGHAEAKRGRSICRADVQAADDLTPAQKATFAAVGFRALINVPLLKSGRLVAFIAVHFEHPHESTPADVALVQETADRTWAAVERARAEAKLRESEERFRLFVDNVQEYALVQTNPDGRIASWNPGAQRLFGYRPEQIMDQDFSILLTPEDREAGVFQDELAAVTNGQRNEDARWFVRQDSSCFWARWITEPMLDEAGRFRGLAKVMRDETEREQVEAFTRHSLAEKAELLKEVHHRVKNNLQVIVSLLNMQTAQIDDQNVLALFQETRNRVLAISSIHELLYRSESFASISLADYARQLAPGLVQFYGLNDACRCRLSAMMQRSNSNGLYPTACS